MAVVEKTIDLIGDDLFTDTLLAKRVLPGVPVDIYDEAVTKLRSYALYGFEGAQSFSFPNVTSLSGYTFSSARNVKRIELPSCISLGGNNFRECPDLEEVVAPLLRSAGQYEFVWSPKIKTANYPYLENTSDGFWYNCEVMESCYLPRLKILGYATFLGTPKLLQIDLPSIESIGENCVSGAAESGVRTMNLGPNLTTIHANAFGSAPAGMIVNMAISEGAIAGAPWGGAEIVINYDVPYSGTVPMPED